VPHHVYTFSSAKIAVMPMKHPIRWAKRKVISSSLAMRSLRACSTIATASQSSHCLTGLSSLPTRHRAHAERPRSVGQVVYMAICHGRLMHWARIWSGRDVMIDRHRGVGVVEILWRSARRESEKGATPCDETQRRS
jgi:hypothetical protein